jgi:hypothetical protein
MSGEHGVLGLQAHGPILVFKLKNSFRMGRALATGIETVELPSSTL